jgi:hypothetical protein
VKFKIELDKEVIWKERFNPLNHFPIIVLMGFEKWEKGLDLLVNKMGLNTMLICRLGLDDVPFRVDIVGFVENVEIVNIVRFVENVHVV